MHPTNFNTVPNIKLMTVIAPEKNSGGRQIRIPLLSFRDGTLKKS